MMDSDDEDRRHNRDKFRRERSDNYAERRDREDRRGGRDDWNDRPRDNRVNRDWQRRDYNRNRRERGYSPARRAMSPPNKRPRRDWNTGGYRSFSNYGGNYQGGGGGYWDRSGDGQNYGHSQSDRTDGGSSMMTFKQFLASQDDTIDDQEAVRKYNEYKVDFRRTQLSEYFLAHKDQEWFRTKYHPDLCMQQQAARVNGVRLRLNAFLDLWREKWIDTAACEFNKSDDIIRILDAAVIKMEGGTDLDMTILDQKEEDSEEEMDHSRDKRAAEIVKDDEMKKEKDKEKKNGKEDGEMDDDSDEKPEEDKKSETKGEEKADGIEEIEEKKPEDMEEGEKRGKKRKREREYSSSSSSSGSSSESDSDSDRDRSPKIKDKQEKSSKPPESKEEKDEEAGEITEDRHSTKVGKEEASKKKVTEDKVEEEGPKPRPLHKTYSLFMRSLSVMIPKAEIVQLCKKYQGFMRVALADPQPDKNFMRYGWVTFDRSVNIKDICWNLSSIRVRDCELSPVVNRDLTRRIRATSGITSHKQIVRNDLKLAAKLIKMLDDRYKLYEEPEPEPEKIVEEVKEQEVAKKEEEEKKAEQGEEKEEKEKAPEEKSFEVEKLPFVPFHGYQQNPFLENITEYLVEESSAEEEMLVAMGGGTEDEDEGEHKDEAPGYKFERDQELNKVLDRLLFYLRIVHSMDYYNASEYPIEDEMPNRCGIMHARGANPPKGLTEKDVNEWQTNFEKKIVPMLQTKSAVDETEWTKLGKKQSESEVEKFVQANTQELSKDKWLCPLSGKKFKGPEFVRKHIFNKHSEKIDEVRKDVEYFNNYLKDPKRPQPPEPTVAAKPAQSANQGGASHGSAQGGYQPHQSQNHGESGFRHSWGNQNQGFDRGSHHDNRNQYGGGFYNRGQSYQGGNRQRRDPRPLIQYRDLDAPGDDDIF
ncbi:serrate RNA effector molecule homolog isoform X2 [Anneissia japonica]|uniref:serrate RNA effector molecule homolog isoform X2 n=1 Tax=Anneissia japonica TaxID=1529436 RepID=UPI0014255316|nr:serrate RNA effector molecule homolog isoform X2 [Anneissia japonica]